MLRNLFNKLTYKSYFFATLFLYLVFAKNIVLPTPGGIGLYLSPNIISWIFISLIMSLGIWQISKNRKLLLNNIQIKVALGFLLLSIPAIYPHSNIYYYLPRIIAFGIGIIFFTVLSQFKFTHAQKISVLFILLIGVAIEAMLGALQYYILLKFDINITGYTPIAKIPYGTFTQKNVMASFMATGISLSLFLLKNTESNIATNKKPYTIFCYFCIFICTLLIVLQHSKTGYVALLLVLLFFIPRFFNSKLHNKNIFISLILGFSIGIFSNVLSEKQNKSPTLVQDKHRMTMYRVSLEMIKEKPLLGFGYGNFERNYRETYIKNMKDGKIIKAPQNSLIHPHNEILLWIIEGGIIAFLGILVILYSYISTLTLSKIQTQLPLIALITPILIHTQLEYPFYISICHYIYFIFLFWFITDATNEKKVIQLRHPISLKLISIIIPLIIIPFMLTTLHTSYLMDKYKQTGFSKNDYIHKIINKLSWNEYITITLQTESLRNGFKLKDPAKLNNYINWGKEYVKNRPREEIYQNMIIAIETLENVKMPIDYNEKQTLFTDAARLYPSNKKFVSAFYAL